MSLSFSSAYAVRVYRASLLPAKASILVPTLNDVKSLPPWRVPEHTVLLPTAIFTVFWHNSPLPGSGKQTFLCSQTTHILWNMLTPVFSIFKLVFSLARLPQQNLGDTRKLLLCLFPWPQDEDCQTGTVCMDFFCQEYRLMSDLTPSGWSSCIVSLMGCDPVLDYTKDFKEEHYILSNWTLCRVSIN